MSQYIGMVKCAFWLCFSIFSLMFWAHGSTVFTGIFSFFIGVWATFLWEEYLDYLFVKEYDT